MNSIDMVIKSLVYKFLERFGSFFITFVIQLVLARLLSPKDFGIVAILTVFINIAQVFVQSGFSTSLIQKKNVTEIDYSSVFYISFFISIVLYLILFLSAPTIEIFYSMENLSDYLRVVSIIIIIGSFNSVQLAIVSREMKFHFLLYSTIISNLISGLIGIFLALRGYGIWSLIFQQLISSFLNCITLSYRVRWFPKLIFSFSSIKALFAFGWKILLSSFLETIYVQLQSLIIGRRFSANILGYYNKGQQFPQIIITNVNGAIQSVMLPTLSKIQDDKIKMKSVVRRSVKTSSFLIFPLMTFLGVLGSPIIALLLGNQWRESVPFLQVSCFIFSLMPIHTANLQALNAMGRSDLFLKLEIFKKIIGVIILVAAILLFSTPMAIAVGTAISSVISLIINIAPSRKLLDYNYSEQIKDILPYIFISFTCGVGLYIFTFMPLNNFLTVFFGGILASVSYLILSYIFKLDSFMYILNYVIKRRRNNG
ncbi:hypothetical protein IGJ26_002124 [Enterococcus sp. AZ095a]|uniref:lipopolysaccharide biosynthesis protein n=2 Tax=unclassified Enterococcus TaxID=2608891 RepID=UPI003D2F9CCF